MRWTTPVAIVALLALMAGAALHYRALYLPEEQARQHIQAQAEAEHAALAQVNRQMQTVAALDWQYTRELEHDKKRIARLERDVADGRRRLQVNATCPAVSTGSPATPGVDDAATPGLTDSAQRDYFTLRERIEISGKQIAGLQQYITEQCLK